MSRPRSRPACKKKQRSGESDGHDAYILARAAERDLDDLWEYIAQDNLAAADRLIAEIFNAFESLARNPGIGHKRDDLTNLPIVFWPVGNYLIIYRVAGNRVEIVAIVHTRRDIPGFLRQRGE